MTTTGTGRNLNRDEIADALSFLDPSCDRKEWIRIGAAVKAAGAAIGEDLFEVWRAWSERGQGYNAKTIASDWKSLLQGDSVNPISAGTLVYLAKAKGWIDPRKERVGLTGALRSARLAKIADLEERAPGVVDAILSLDTGPEEGERIEAAREEFAKTLERNGYEIYDWYRYSDDFFVYRLENEHGPETKKLILPVSFDGKAWKCKAPEGLRPLYNLEQIVAADPKEMILVVEGEKCAKKAEWISLLATTSSSGSQSAGRTDWSPLRGRSVCILPDRDSAGEAYALAVEKTLRSLDCEVRVLRLNPHDGSPAAEGFDIADWIDKGLFAWMKLPQPHGEHDIKGWMRKRLKDLIDKESKIVVRREGASLLDDLEGFEESIAETHGLEFIGLPSGCFPRLDSMLDGWQGLGVLAAEPGIGKTTLLLQTGLGIVTTNEDAAFVFVSLEMGRTAMMRRLVSQTTRIPYRTLRKGEKDQDEGEDGLHFSEQTRSRLRRGLENLRDLAPRIAILDSEDFSGGISVEEFGERLIQRVEAFKAKTGCSRAFVVVDHLGKLPTGPQANLSTLERDDAKISALLSAQRRLGSDPIVVISQVRKSDYERPGLASAKGSAEISYSPDFYIAAWRPDKGSQDASEYGVDLPKETYFECEIVKGRDGMIRGRVAMKFLVDEHRIEEVR